MPYDETTEKYNEWLGFNEDSLKAKFLERLLEEETQIQLAFDEFCCTEYEHSFDKDDDYVYEMMRDRQMEGDKHE